LSHIHLDSFPLLFDIPKSGPAGTKRSKIKGVSRKGAKDAKKIFSLGFKTPIDLAFLCELGVSALPSPRPLRETLLPFLR
jgi:hypothetical protein